MAVRTTVTGAAWPTSGAATTGTTGFSATSGLTHVGSTDIPVSSSATGYLESAENTAASFKLDSTAAGTSGVKYTVEFWLRCVRVNLDLPNRTNAETAFPISFTNGGTDYRIQYSTVKSSTNVRNLSGVIFYPRLISGGGSPTAELLIGAGLSGGITRPNLNFEKWVKIGIAITPGASGEFALYMNGQCMGKQTTLNTTAQSTATLDNFTFNLPALLDLKWQICGTIRSWDNTGNTTLTQAPTANSSEFTSPSNYDLAFHWPARWADGTEGAAWKKNSGTLPTSVPTNYSTAGTSNLASRQVFTATGAQGAVLESTRSVGVLPYNAEGWATIYVRDILMTGSATSTAKIALRNSGNSADIFSIQINGTGLCTLIDSFWGTLTNIPLYTTIGKRYSVAIALNSDGRRQVTLHNLTDAAVGSAVYDLIPMMQTVGTPVWAAQAIGPIQLTLTLAANLDTAEFGGVSVHRYLDLAGVDSYTQSIINVLTPEMTSPYNRMGDMYMCAGDCEAGCWPAKFIPPNNGPVYSLMQAIGWSGKSMARFSSANGEIARSCAGIRYIQFGGIANDVSGATTYALADSLSTAWANQVKQIVQGIVSNESRADIFLPCIGGTGGGFASAFALTMVQLAVQKVISFFLKMDSLGRVRFLNTATNYIGADGVHPDASGQAAWAQEIINRGQLAAIDQSNNRAWVRV